MWVGTEVWKHASFKESRARVKARAATIAIVPSGSAEGPIASLVRQVFLSNHGVRRTRVLLVSPGPETNVHAFAENVGKVLSELTGVTVALLESHSNSAPAASSNTSVCGSRDPEFWRCHASQVTKRLWRLPADLLPQTPNTDQLSAPRGTTSDELPFDYVIFAAQVSDSILPLFCSHCDGAVLVITANQTRRQSALLAMRVLRQCNTEVLGTVLDGRQFPIPESIYQRL